ncbi:hypothetical protein UFOVP654_68 [uncultured Caudovirales phage]|uniref:Uncharacterized protein n=1 Tax=uncultured Caudovirales phage TaxID=2100421 RepID=A0A6J5NAH4_9CAUD|nr:hypothetical protein UFOVP654_68 [uncultured Caudovirales phage]
MNCCNSHGECTQGRDCPVRKQRAEETNKAYINQNNGLEPDLLDDFAASIKGLIAVIVVVTGITLLAFTLWGK